MKPFTYRFVYEETFSIVVGPATPNSCENVQNCVKSLNLYINVSVCSSYEFIRLSSNLFILSNELPNSSVDKTLTAKQAVEKDLGRAYCTDKCEMRSTVKACLSMSACRSSSGAKSRQMCMEGTPLTVIGSRSKGYP